MSDGDVDARLVGPPLTGTVASEAETPDATTESGQGQTTTVEAGVETPTPSS